MLLAIGGSIGYSLGLKSSQTRLTKNINRPKMTNSKSPQKQPFKISQNKTQLVDLHNYKVTHKKAFNLKSYSNYYYNCNAKC
jgi:hypothetical protein